MAIEAFSTREEVRGSFRSVRQVTLEADYVSQLAIYQPYKPQMLFQSHCHCTTQTMSNPAISVNIALEPATVTLGATCSIILSTTLLYPTPITIYTWPTVFNLDLSQIRKNFWCIDLSNNNESVRLELTKGGKRSGYICRELGSFHDPFFVTLEPGKAVDITAPFVLTTRLDKPLVAGHRYRFGFSEGECVGDWMHGTREDVMLPSGDRSPMDSSGPYIMLDVGPPIEFEVLESEPLGYEPQQAPTSIHGRLMHETNRCS